MGTIYGLVCKDCNENIDITKQGMALYNITSIAAFVFYHRNCDELAIVGDFYEDNSVEWNDDNYEELGARRITHSFERIKKTCENCKWNNFRPITMEEALNYRDKCGSCIIPKAIEFDKNTKCLFDNFVEK